MNPVEFTLTKTKTKRHETAARRIKESSVASGVDFPFAVSFGDQWHIILPDDAKGTEAPDVLRQTAASLNADIIFGDSDLNSNPQAL